MKEILIPFVNNNETEATLNEWLVDDHAEVKKGEIIATLETTKAEVDLEVEYDGKIKIMALPGKHYEFGSTVAWIYQKDIELEGLIGEKGNIKKVDFIITGPAKKFMEENDISEKQIESLGLKYVKAKDLEHLVKNKNILEIDSKQVTIANTVLSSKLTIPDAFNLKKVYVDTIQKSIIDFSKKNKINLGIPELLIFVVSKLHKHYPFFFGEVLKSNQFLTSESVNIGITLDLGKGLYVPVVSSVEILSIRDITIKLMEFKIKALKNSFKAVDFEKANIAISLNMDQDTVHVQPIIFPGQTCMISVGAVMTEICKEGENYIEKQFINIGLSYDHRVINGFDANNFLTEIKTYFEGTKDLKLK